jgi:hypothetical protein
MVCNGRKFKKQIAQALCWNAVRKTQLMSLPRIYNYLGLPHSVTSQLARKWSRHSPYDLENVNGCWEHLWKASPQVRETTAC